MLKTKNLIVIAVLGLIFSVDAGTSTVQAQWYQAYKNGVKAVKNGNWEQGVSWFTQSVRQKPRDSKKMRASGVMFIQYYANRELGVCYFHLGQIEKAKYHLRMSNGQVRSARAKRFLDRIRRGDYPRAVANPESIVTPRKKVIVSPPSNRRRPTLPAQLTANIFFVEPSNNGFLDADEAGKVIVDVSNRGRGDAWDVQVKIRAEDNVPGLTIGYPRKISQLAPGTQESIIVAIQCGAAMTSRQVRLRVDIAEANGFDLDPPSYLTFSTKSLEPPVFTISDIGIKDNSQNRRIEPREIVDITARIRNDGQGAAQGVTATIQAGANVFLTPDSKTQFSLNDLRPGESKDVTFTVFTNSKATSVPIDIILTESRGRYDKTLPLDLPFNKPQLASKDFVISGGRVAGTTDFETNPLSIDVDENIPGSRNHNPDAIAIILGVETYASIPAVSYAKRDAAIFREYAKSVLGVPDSKHNIYYRTDQEVTKGEMLKLFTGNSWLRKRSAPTSDIYVFYAGHGAPDIRDETPYLIPFDGDANYPSQTGFSLTQMYEGLAQLNARSVTVFLDACFSGATRENQMLLADARPVLIKIKHPVLMSDKLVVFSASSGNQISSGFPEMKHGLFTYFLLKGLRGEANKNQDATLTVEELEAYLVTNVNRTAGRLDREQTPTVMGRNKGRAIVRF